MQSLGTAILIFIVGLAAGWASHEFTGRISGFGEAEELLPSVTDAMQLPTGTRSYFGKLLLHDPNGDRVILVNNTYQFRVSTGKKPVIEPLGTQ
jgi:hypothetical protein